LEPREGRIKSSDTDFPRKPSTRKSSDTVILPLSFRYPPVILRLSSGNTLPIPRLTRSDPTPAMGTSFVVVRVGTLPGSCGRPVGSGSCPVTVTATSVSVSSAPSTSQTIPSRPTSSRFLFVTNRLDPSPASGYKQSSVTVSSCRAFRIAQKETRSPSLVGSCWGDSLNEKGRR
jgi:hypothetical protein